MLNQDFVISDTEPAWVSSVFDIYLFKLRQEKIPCRLNKNV